MGDLVFRAMKFASFAHATQVRKYTREPYFKHLAEVAALVHSVGGSPEQVAIAWLHDTLEDQPELVTPATLLFEFGPDVATGVRWLTDVEEGNRATRKALAIERLSLAPGSVQTVKYADLISNTSSIRAHDSKFAPLYLSEKRELLAHMTRGEPRLYAMAKEFAGV